MAKDKLIADRSEPAKPPRRDALPQRRKTENLPNGLYYFEDELEIEGVLETNVITCEGWLLEVVNIRAGEVSFLSEAAELRPHFSQLAIFYPPFTLTRPSFNNVKANLRGIAGTAPLPPKFMRRPFVFEGEFVHFPKSVPEIVGIFEALRQIQFVEARPKASILSLRAKRLIDENYKIFPSIARIAARLNVSHAHLTRQFKRDFGFSPNAYLHQIRIADATFRLMRGESIIKVSGDVGYHDLSRFYKQFRKANAASPGFCRGKS